MRRALALALGLLALVTACSVPRSGAGSRTFTIGAVYPLSGPQATGGREELSGVQLALDLAREHNLLGSRTVKLVVRDATTPTAAVSAVDNLIDTQHVDMLIGTYGSTLAEAAAAEADRRHVVYWETGAVSDGVTMNKRYVFRTVAAGSTLGNTAVEFVAAVLLPQQKLHAGDTRAAIVYVNDAYGKSVAFAEAARARSHGIPVVAMLPYDAAFYDASTLASQIAAARPDFLFDVSYIDDGVAIWQQVVRQHVKLRAAVGTSSAFCMPAFAERVGPAAAGVYAADKPDEQVNAGALSPAAKALLGAARTRYAATHSGAQLSIPVMAGLVGGWTLFYDVLPQLGAKTDSETIRSAALRVDVAVSGAPNGGGVRFGTPGSADEGQNQLAASEVGQWELVNGRMDMRILYPAAYASDHPMIHS